MTHDLRGMQGGAGECWGTSEAGNLGQPGVWGEGGGEENNETGWGGGWEMGQGWRSEKERSEIELGPGKYSRENPGCSLPPRAK